MNTSIDISKISEKEQISANKVDANILLKKKDITLEALQDRWQEILQQIELSKENGDFDVIYKNKKISYKINKDQLEIDIINSMIFESDYYQHFKIYPLEITYTIPNGEKTKKMKVCFSIQENYNISNKIIWERATTKAIGQRRDIIQEIPNGYELGPGFYGNNHELHKLTP